MRHKTVVISSLMPWRQDSLLVSFVSQSYAEEAIFESKGGKLFSSVTSVYNYYEFLLYYFRWAETFNGHMRYRHPKDHLKSSAAQARRNVLQIDVFLVYEAY